MQKISLKLPDDLLAPGAPSCYELARDLAGAVKGMPKDLADNPKYMEGFGE
jgi:hypothetical protein